VFDVRVCGCEDVRMISFSPRLSRGLSDSLPMGRVNVIKLSAWLRRQVQNIGRKND
jgi:hypothetical protein